MIWWEYWCKAIGIKAYDDNTKSDIVAIIRTIGVLISGTTCFFIIANAANNLFF